MWAGGGRGRRCRPRKDEDAAAAARGRTPAAVKTPRNDSEEGDVWLRESRRQRWTTKENDGRRCRPAFLDPVTARAPPAAAALPRAQGAWTKGVQRWPPPRSPRRRRRTSARCRRSRLSRRASGTRRRSGRRRSSSRRCRYGIGPGRPAAGGGVPLTRPPLPDARMPPAVAEPHSAAHRVLQWALPRRPGRGASRSGARGGHRHLWQPAALYGASPG